MHFQKNKQKGDIIFKFNNASSAYQTTSFPPQSLTLDALIRNYKVLDLFDISFAFQWRRTAISHINKDFYSNM